MVEGCQRGYVEKLIVENFKSYAGRHEIGPFKRFSCIIGPNGSGKSNVMDALCFVLGIQARHLRGERMIDLIYRREEECLDQLGELERHASVTLIFVMPGNDGDEGRGRMHIARVIDPKGQSQYKFGSASSAAVKLRNIDFAELQKHLKEVNIFVKARNFLVFQGDVMDLARRQGIDLTKVLEQISGSDELKGKMEQLETEKRIAEEKQRVFFAKKRQTDQHKCDLEREKSDLDKYHQLQEESKRIKLEGCLFDLYAREMSIVRAKKELEKIQLLVKEKSACYEEKLKATEELDRTRKKLSNHVNTFETAFKKMQAESNEVRCEKERLLRTQHAFNKALRDIKSKQEELGNAVVQKTAALEGMTKDITEGYDALEEVKKEIKEKEHNLFSPEQQKLWNDAETRARTLNSAKKRDLEDRQAQLKELQSVGKDLDRKKAELENHLGELNNRLLQTQRNVDNQSKDVDQAKQEVARDERALAPKEKELSELRAALQTLINEKKAIERNLADMKEHRQQQTQNRNQRDIVGELRYQFPGVVERVNELIVPSSITSQDALAAALGPNRYYLVCDTSATARQCVAHLKYNKREPLTFLPLDGIKQNLVKGLHTLVRRNGRKLATGICKANAAFYESSVGKQFEPRMQLITEKILNATIGDCN